MKPHIRLKPTRPRVVPISFPVDDDVVRVLSQFMERASDGHLDGVAVAGVNRDGSVSTAYVVPRNMFTLLGAIENIRRRVGNEALG